MSSAKGRIATMNRRCSYFKRRQSRICLWRSANSVRCTKREKGVQVTGSDQNVYPPMSTFLAERRIEVISGYAEHNLAHKPDLVVIGNAISRGNPEAEAVLERKLHYGSLPELLKELFIRGKRSLVVSSTHGKTTTASLLTWVFEHNGFNPSFLIGGI